MSGLNIAEIKAMNLSEDGVLVMQLEQRRLLIRAFEAYRRFGKKFISFSFQLNKFMNLAKAMFSVFF